jgi:hypothetical protein
MLASTDHTLLELSAILSHDVLHADLLQINSCLEILGEDFIATKVPHCLVKLVVLATHFNHIVDKQSSCSLQFRMDAFPDGSVWHVGQDKQIFGHVFLLQKLVANSCRLFRINDQHPKTLLKRHLHSDVISAIDRLNQLIKLSQVTFVSALEFF